MKRKTFNLLALAALAGPVAISAAVAEPVQLVHVHGLSFSSDGKKLMIPSHFGLAVYEAVSGARRQGQLMITWVSQALAQRSTAAAIPLLGLDWLIRSG